MSFHFERPAGFEWRAGQSLDLYLVNPPETDEEGNSRAFSIVAAPHEEEIAIATRMRDTAFKRVLKAAEVGMPVEIDGPFGDFVLHTKCERAAIFLVGGIGITPFYSMMKEATQKNSEHRIYLFYSNRRPEDTVFLKEIRELASRNPRITFVPTMTDMDKSQEHWDGERGFVTREMIERHAPDTKDAVYYTAGPAAMVKAMRELLNAAGISDDDIRTEEFAGY